MCTSTAVNEMDQASTYGAMSIHLTGDVSYLDFEGRVAHRALNVDPHTCEAIAQRTHVRHCTAIGSAEGR